MNCCCFSLLKKNKKNDLTENYDRSNSNINILSSNNISDNSKEENPTG